MHAIPTVIPRTPTAAAEIVCLLLDIVYLILISFLANVIILLCLVAVCQPALKCWLIDGDDDDIMIFSSAGLTMAHLRQRPLGWGAPEYEK